MKTLIRGAAVGLALALGTQAAHAQAGLSLGLGAGAVIPTGSMADLNSTGWTGQTSLRVKPAVSPLGFQVDASYSRMGLDSDLIDVFEGLATHNYGANVPRSVRKAEPSPL